jgi:hypothetical protein
MTTRLLLDFDGVMLKNKHAEQYQLRRSAKFVQHVTHLDLKTCERMNKKYYPIHGHTVLMTNKLFGLDVTLADYNEFVFAPSNIARLTRVLDDDTMHHMKAFNHVIDFCEQNNLEWNVFTNAHMNWVMFFSELLGVQRITTSKVIWPGNDVHALKPNAMAYDNVEAVYANTDCFIFVDDSKANLVVPEERNEWLPILFHKNYDTASTVVDSLIKITHPSEVKYDNFM